MFERDYPRIGVKTLFLQAPGISKSGEEMKTDISRLAPNDH